MIGTFFALFCAVSLVFVGDLNRAADMSVGILLVWGIGIFFLPRPKNTGWKLLGTAAVVRLLLLPAGAGLSSEAPRLLSDASQLWQGGNPYMSSIPSAFSPMKLWIVAPLGGLGGDLWPLQLASIGSDLLVLWLLTRVLGQRRRCLDAAWIYALHPIGAMESAVHGGLDSLVMATVLLAVLAWSLGRSGLGWASLGGLLGGFPLVLIPALWRRSPWILGPAACLALLLIWPLADAGSAIWDGLLLGFTEPGLPGLLHLLFESIIGSAITGVATVLGLLLLIQIWMRWRDPIDLALWGATALVLVAPSIDPGTIIWVWIPALVCGVRAWSVLAALAPLSYLCLPSLELSLLGPSASEWIPWVVFLPFLSSFAVEYLRHLSRPGPWQAGPAMRTSL